MKTLVAVTVVLAVMLLSLAGVPACAARMEGGKEKLMEKGDAMEKSGTVTNHEKAMMTETAGTMMEQKSLKGMRSARLVGSSGHHAAGTLVLKTDQNGVALLQLKDMTVDKVPDGRVYLARNGDYRNGVELGKLTQFSGAVNFPVPAGVRGEDYNSVVIWCRKFNVEIGHAFFDQSMEAGGSMMEKERK